MKRVLTATVCVALFALVGMASAKVLTFDDLPSIPYDGTNEPVAPIGTYGGFTWSAQGGACGGQSDFRYTNPHDLHDYYNITTGSGFANGRKSEPHVAYNDCANQVTIFGGAFDFKGVWLTAAWRNDLNITVEGYSGGILMYSETVVVNPFEAQWFHFNFLDIDTLAFTSFGGSDAGLAFDYANFVMDDFTFTVKGKAMPWISLLLLGY